MSEKPQYLFTVFTPTHNRAHTLERVYQSLVQQTCRDFEWLVIDNESNDDTPHLIERWCREGLFPIRYIYKANEGYCVSYNLALEKARGHYFIELSSDDACADTALERFAFHWASIPADEHDNYIGVTALSANQYGELYGRRFPANVIDSNFTEMRYRYRVDGEKWGCFRTAAIRRYPFTPIDRGSYINEGNIWQCVAQAYRTRYINETLLTFWIHSEQLTKRNPALAAVSNAFWHQTVLNDDINWFRWSPYEFLRSAVHFSRFSFHASVSTNAQSDRLKNPLARVLWITALPIGWAVYKQDCLRFSTGFSKKQLKGQHSNV